MNMSNGLTKLNNATRLLAEVRNARDAKNLMDKAGAAEHYAKKAKLGDDAIGHAHAIKIDAKRMLGEFMEVAPKHKGGNIATLKQKPTGTKKEPVGTLAEAGLSKRLSADSQALAEIARTKPDAFEKVRSGKMTEAQAKREVAREQKRAELAAKAATVVDMPKAACGWTIISGDCVERLAALDRGAFRLAFADPPYNIGIDYGGGAKADLLADDKFVSWCGEWIGLVYVQIAPFHLQRYADEEAFRFNNRKTDDQQRFDTVMRTTAGRRITYRQLCEIDGCGFMGLA